MNVNGRVFARAFECVGLIATVGFQQCNLLSGFAIAEIDIKVWSAACFEAGQSDFVTIDGGGTRHLVAAFVSFEGAFFAGCFGRRIGQRQRKRARDQCEVEKSAIHNSPLTIRFVALILVQTHRYSIQLRSPLIDRQPGSLKSWLSFLVLGVTMV